MNGSMNDPFPVLDLCSKDLAVIGVNYFDRSGGKREIMISAYFLGLETELCRLR